MTGFALVTTTLGGAEEARAMAQALVEARLAACVQVMAVASIYRWQGKIEEAVEHMLVAKIDASAFAEVATAIRARHPYDVPEIVMTPIVAADPVYRKWLEASLGDAEDVPQG